ncbi:hypothetical protein D3C78_1036150 [compost metagenome]
MQEGEFAFAGGVADHIDRATGHVADQPDQVEQAADDDDHLQEVSQRNGPHAAEQGVQQNDDGADDHALGGGQPAIGQHAEDHAQRGDLRGDPAHVGNDDHQAGEDFHVLAVALAEEVADGEQVQAVQRTGKDEADQHQAAEGAERVFDDPGETFFEERRRNTQHRFGAEPGGEHHGDDEGEGHAPASGSVVRGVVHAGGGVKTDSDGDQQVYRYKPDQHLYFPLARPTPARRAWLGQGRRDY